MCWACIYCFGLVIWVGSPQPPFGALPWFLVSTSRPWYLVLVYSTSLLPSLRNDTISPLVTKEVEEEKSPLQFVLNLSCSLLLSLGQKIQLVCLWLYLLNLYLNKFRKQSLRLRRKFIRCTYSSQNISLIGAQGISSLILVILLELIRIPICKKLICIGTSRHSLGESSQIV